LLWSKKKENRSQPGGQKVSHEYSQQVQKTEGGGKNTQQVGRERENCPGIIFGVFGGWGGDGKCGKGRV